MNKDICQKCNRKLIFTDNNELCCTSGRRKNFFCYSKIEKHEFDFSFCNITAYLLTESKWKLINFGLFKHIIFPWSRSKYINDLFKEYKGTDLFYDEIDFICPYLVEHQISEWNEK